MRPMPKFLRRSAAALAVASLLTAPVPVAATPLGSPRMHVVSGTVAPPYSPNFVLSTAVSTWPTLVQWDVSDEPVKDATGSIRAGGWWWWSSSGLLANWGVDAAHDDGTFSSVSEMQTPSSFQNHLGVFGAVTWSQSFRKDSVTASYHYTISRAQTYARCMTTGARAEFAIDNAAYMGLASFYQFHQDGGVVMFGNPPQLPSVVTTSHGPMTWSGSNPDGIQRDYQMDFAGHTEEIDLSSVPVGGEFSVTFNLVTRAHIAYDEIVRSRAYVQDPGSDSVGITMVLAGLTPTDNPQLPTLGIGPVAVAGVEMSSPWPNPGRGPVRFTLELPRATSLGVEVYDLTGRHVATLSDGVLEAGLHPLAWDARDTGGRPVPAGVYLVRAAGPGVHVVRRIVHLGTE